MSFYVEGLASDLKTVPADMVVKRAQRTGDGTSPHSKVSLDDKEAEMSNNNNNEDVRDTEHFWGWGEFVASKLLMIESLKLFL